jgi:hypothetical protein
MTCMSMPDPDWAGGGGNPQETRKHPTRSTAEECRSVVGAGHANKNPGDPHGKVAWTRSHNRSSLCMGACGSRGADKPTLTGIVRGCAREEGTSGGGACPSGAMPFVVGHCRMTMVGNGGAGKTTLSTRLVTGTLVPSDVTHGVMHRTYG